MEDAGIVVGRDQYQCCDESEILFGGKWQRENMKLLVRKVHKWGVLFENQITHP